MDIRKLTDRMSVAPQLAEEDLASLAAEGYTTLINNRPDEELAMTGGPGSEVMAAEAAAQGMAYHYIPVPGSGFGIEHVRAVRRAIEEADGPVIAYCRSGTRSCNVWALAIAGGDMSAEEISAAGRAGGYDLSAMMDMLHRRID
jgi:uncharacterized protein (TIGR01244 family)